MTLAVCFALLTVLQIPLALGGQLPINPSAKPPVMPEYNHPSSKDNSNNPHESRYKFERYIKEKYKQIKHAESDVKQTMNGPSGKVWLSGDIEPQKKVALDLSKEPDRHVRSRAIAKVFMDDEPALLGITNSYEMQEMNISTDKGFEGDYTHINYHKFINGIELKNADLLIVVGPKENIFSVHARLVPVSSEVYEATQKNTLSEDEVKSIVETDLAADDNSGYDKLRKAESDSRGHERIQLRRSFKKVAITTPPYVIWEVSYITYIYNIDAFTGKIMNKIDSITPPVLRKKSTSTDQKFQGDARLPMPTPILPQK